MPATIVTTVKDAIGKSSTYEVNVPLSFSLVQLVGAAQDIADLVDALVGGVITNVGINIGVDFGALGLKVAAEANTDVEEGARFLFRTVGNFITSFRLPTFKEEFMLPGTETVDVLDPAVDALVSALIDGTDVLGVPVTFVDKREADVIALSAAVDAHQAER